MRKRGGMLDAFRAELKRLAWKREAIGFVCAVDLRQAERDALREWLRFEYPAIEIRVSNSGARDQAELTKSLRYYGIDPRQENLTVRDALCLFEGRYPEVVQALPRAHKSADDSAFQEPSLVLAGLHALLVVTVWWEESKRADRTKAVRARITVPQREGMRRLIEDARFDVSGSSAEHHWPCPDEVKRDFGWHLKWSLAGPRDSRYHVRVHYHVGKETLFIGHCGDHL